MTTTTEASTTTSRVSVSLDWGDDGARIDVQNHAGAVAPQRYSLWFMAADYWTPVTAYLSEAQARDLYRRLGNVLGQEASA